MAIIHLIVVRLFPNFPFAVGAVAADTFFPEFTQSLMRLALKGFNRIERLLLGFLERHSLALWLLGFLLHPFHIEAFFIQVDQDMLLEVDGIVSIIYLTDDEAFLVHGTAGGLHFGIIEDFMQAADGIGILGRTFRRDVHQVRSVYLEYLAQQFHFGCVLRTELLDEADAVVAVYGLGHERRQGSALAIVVDDTFLYIGVLFPYLAVNLALGYLGVEREQAVYVVLDAVKPL